MAKVLIVDDDETIRDTLYELLSENYLCQTAETAEKALARIEADTYDVVFSRYNSVDIALDPFPFTGALTTCDALAMGVPVVTLEGERLVSRQSQGILGAMGLSMLIAKNHDDYARLAIELAESVTLRSNLRRTLRTSLAASRVCDGEAFVRGVETLFARCAVP